MNTNHAIIIAGAVIAGALLVALRWDIAISAGGQPFRLDRWDGDIVACSIDTQKRADAASIGVGIEYRCQELTKSEMEKKALDPTIH